MVRKTHQGRPGYKVFPDDWGERLAPAANQTHTAVCEIRAPETRGAFNPTLGTYTTVAGTLRYQGACRVQRRSADQLGIVTEQALPSVGYLVSIDHAANTVEVHDRVTITDSSDPQLIGQVLAVATVYLGSLRAARDLYCTDDLST